MTDTPLLLALELASAVVGKRNTIPIVDCALLTRSEDWLLVEATDLDVEVAVYVPGKFPAFKPLAVPVHKLRGIMAHLGGDGEFEVVANPRSDADRRDALRVAGAYTVPGLPAVDWPRMTPPPGDGYSFELPADRLLAILDAVRFAVSTEETRYYLNGIFIHPSRKRQEVEADDSIMFAATDGHRLNWLEIPHPGARALPAGIVPRLAVKVLRRALELHAGEAAVVTFHKLKATFDVGPVSIRTKLIDGTFPEYQRVIPTAPTGSLVVKASELRKLVDGARVLPSEKVRAVTLNLKARRITATCPEFGMYAVDLPGEVEGEVPDRIGFNSAYLSTMLDGFGDSDVRISFTDKAGPSLIRASEADGRGGVLMPMKVD